MLLLCQYSDGRTGETATTRARMVGKEWFGLMLQKGFVYLG